MTVLTGNSEKRILCQAEKFGRSRDYRNLFRESRVGLIISTTRSARPLYIQGEDIVQCVISFTQFTINEIDKVLLPYAKKSIRKYLNEAKRYGIRDREAYACEKVREEMRQGLQSLEVKLNTITTSRGDTAFVTFTFGCVDGKSERNNEIQREICRYILKTRMAGQGEQGIPVVFPKLVYLHRKEQNEHPSQDDLFELALGCTSECMYPDVLSLDAGHAGEMYDLTGKVVGPMGCRSYLGPWQDSKGEYHFNGRSNVGVVSLNLPMIWQKSKGKNFWKDLDYYLEMCHKFLQSRYEYIANMPCSTNPLCFCEGGIQGGNKHPWEKIGMDILQSYSASVGITALNELNVLMEGKPLHESDQKKINEVVDKILERIQEWKDAEHLGYSPYATPAESLCFSGDTLVQCYGGNKAIKDIKIGDLVYSFNEKTNKIELKPVIRSMMTNNSANVCKVNFTNGQSIICTPNHPFAKRTAVGNGRPIRKEVIKYVEAKDLKKGDRIKSNYRKVLNGRCKFTTYQYEHDVVCEYFYGKKPDGYVVHHKDENKENNLIENLVYMSDADHRRLHMESSIRKYCFTSDTTSGENNYFYGKKHTKEALENNRIKHTGKNNVSAKPLVKLDLDGNILCEYESSGEVYRTDDTIHNISNALNGKSCTTTYPQYCGHYYKGYLWYFKSDIENISIENHVVESVEYLENPIAVYDITVEDNHNFYVGGDDGILVHNCGTQVKQFRKKFGIIEGVSDREYFTNGFHMHVSADITPFEKQDLEYELFHKIYGGHIQYVKLDNPKNIKAIRKIIERAMKLGFYAGVNFSAITCQDCGYRTDKEIDECPCCGSKNLLWVARICGYLGIRKYNGGSRVNDGKLCEMADRISM